MKGKLSKILHITPWFPSPEKPHVAVWIKRHIDLLEQDFQQHVLHIEMEWGIKRKDILRRPGHTQVRVFVPIKSWRLREYLFQKALLEEIKQLRAQEEFDVVNFHIAYPALIGFQPIQKKLPNKILLTEHWSAYHFHFHASRGLKRLRKMFHHSIPLVTVSKALLDDIEKFSGQAQEATVIPNVVDTTLFHPTNQPKIGWLMLAVWSGPKDPLQVINEFLEAPTDSTLPPLKIGGAGEKWIEIQQKVKQHPNGQRIQLLGPLSPQELALHLQQSEGLILPTSYETFSVITAEALCCGCPVVTNPVGALPELLGHHWPGYKQPHETWTQAIQRVQQANLDMESMSKSIAEMCSPAHVRLLYTQALNALA
jgi:L-malate glycosyltransferase